MYAKILNNAVAQYPYSVEQLYADNPRVGFPSDLTDAVLALHNAARVLITGKPSYNPLTHGVIEATPTYNSSAKRWEQAWQVVSLTAEQIAANKQALQRQIVSQTQARLDDFARTRGYDGILSACTYASSSVPKFAAEGQYCVDARDATWKTLYQILADVKAGSRPTASSYADVEPDLPALVWPV